MEAWMQLLSKRNAVIFFVDPDEIKPKLLFFSLKEMISQDADELYDAIKRAFSDKNADTLLKNVVFFSSDGTAVNQGSKIRCTLLSMHLLCT